MTVAEPLRATAMLMLSLLGMAVFPRWCRRSIAPKTSLGSMRITLCVRVTVSIVAAQLFFILPIEPGKPSVDLF